MRDCDVRAALHAKVLAEHHGQLDTLVVDELALWYGTARVDIAVVNRRIHGFEIKSDRDTLDRLDGQARIYNTVLDRVTLVVGVKHVDHATAAAPLWWGIKLATQGPRRAVHFEELRAPKTNPSIDPVAVAALLWCEELEELLGTVGAVRGYKGKSRDILSRRAAATFALTDLRAAVRVRLKARGNWRVPRHKRDVVIGPHGPPRRQVSGPNLPSTTLVDILVAPAKGGARVGGVRDKLTTKLLELPEAAMHRSLEGPATHNQPVVRDGVADGSRAEERGRSIDRIRDCVVPEAEGPSRGRV